MVLQPLATVADLDARHIEFPDESRALVALRAASAAVREAAGCPITLTTSIVTVYPGFSSPYTALPGCPVRSISAVTVAGVSITSDLWSLQDGQLWTFGTLNCIPPGGVSVTYTHGLDECPDDIVELVCNLASLSMAETTGAQHDPRIESEAIDDSRTTWAAGASPTVLELPERTKLALRERFGGGAYVTGRR